MKTRGWITELIAINKIIQNYTVRGVRVMTLFLCFSFGFVSLTHAQIEGLKKGDRVRLDVPSMNDHRLVGEVTQLFQSTVVLGTKDSTYVIPNSSIDKIAISTGKVKKIGKGALWGALIGGTLGMVVGAGTFKRCDINCGFTGVDKLEAMFTGNIIGILSGSVFGAIIGAREKDRWESIPVKLSMAPSLNRSLNTSLNPTIKIRLSLSRANR